MGEVGIADGTAGGEEPLTRRRLHRPRTGAGSVPRLPVVVRPRTVNVVLLLLVCVMTPSRRGSLLLIGLLDGPTSRTALLAYAIAAGGIVLSVLWVRSRMVLRAGDDDRLVVEHRGLIRRRTYHLGAGYEVRIVGGPARRTVLLDPGGRVTAVLGAFTELWRRDDVVALLTEAGVAVRHEHRINSARDLEAAHPGSTAWLERHPARLYGVVGTATVAGILLLAWFLEG